MALPGVRELKTNAFRDPTTGRFIPNPIGIALLQRGPQMALLLKTEAEKVAAVAKQIAREEAYDTGEYYRGIRAVSGVGEVDGQKALIGRVNAFAMHSGWIEFGSIHNQPAHHVLSRAAEAVGYQVQAATNVRRAVGTGFERLLKVAR